MPEDLDQRVRELQIAVEQTAKRRQRAEVEREAAAEALSKVEARLAEFGVTSPEEAKELLSSMEGALKEALSDARSALERAGGNK